MASADSAAAGSRWHIIDADGQVLGRIATIAARLLQGKNKPTYTPFIDTGDHVVIVNADKVVLTANKGDGKFADRHSGYPGGLKSESYASLLDRQPEVGNHFHHPRFPDAPFQLAPNLGQFVERHQKAA